MSILLYNASVFGKDADYILISHGRIEKIGSGTLPDAKKKIDARGAHIIPGFCDAHTHLENIALMHKTLDLTGLSREETIHIVKKRCSQQEPVIGRGWDETFWKDKNPITATEIEELCPNKVVLLIREDGHMATISKKAERICDVSSHQGIIKETELEKCINTLNLFSSLDFEYAQKMAIERGITCIHDFATESTINEYFRMHREGKLKIRIYASFYKDMFKKIKSKNLHSGAGDEYLRIGALKLFADGSIGARTAATEYRDGKTVKPMITEKKLRALVTDANSHGLRVFTHAIGNMAIDTVINAYKNTSINRIEHFEIPEEEHIDSAPEISMQPNFLKWSFPDGLYHRALSERNFKRNNPYRKITGSSLLFGSDCMPMNPIFGINLVTNPPLSGQKISWEEAILAYTRGARYMSDKLGTLKKGYIADVVVLKNNEVALTVINGKIEYFNSFLLSQG